MNRARRLVATLAFGLAGLAAAPAAYAQSLESDAAPAPGQFEPEPLPPPAQPYVVPDLIPSFGEQLKNPKHWITLIVGLSAVVDYDFFNQDAASLAQVGTQEDQWQVRDLRLMLRGTIGHDYKFNYFVAGVYKGFDTDPSVTWDMVDWWLAFPLGSPATRLTVGKTKESFAYEMVGDSGNLPQQERVLSPFFAARNFGAKLTQVIGADHWMTATVGVFNDWFLTSDSLARSGTDLTARLTGLARDANDGRSYLHLAVSTRYVGADNDTLRYKGRPESNASDIFVDTGSFAAAHAWHLGLEALWNEGPLSVLAEYNRAWVDSPASGDPEFSGYYVTASWVLTGENRPYDRTVAYARRVMPKDRWGAPELVARFSHVDLNDGVVQGGRFDKTYVGLNWWATQHWKLGFGWGRTWLDRFGATGVTDSGLLRFQYVH